MTGRVTGTLIVVARRGGGVYFLKGRDRFGKQHKKKLGPVADWPRKHAEDALRDWLTDLGRAPERGDESLMFHDAARAWLRYVEHDLDRAPSTVRDYRNTVTRYLEPRLGSIPVAAVATADVDRVRVELLEEVSRRTAQKALVLLHGILKLAKRRDWIATNPAENAERVRVRRRTEFAVLSPAEVRAVARKANDAQVAAAIVVAAFTGLRQGELRALRWRDVDFAGRLVHVRRSFTGSSEGTPKSGAARSVPLIDQAARALDELSRRERWTGPADHVFPSPLGGPMSDNDLRGGLYDAMQAAGISRDRGTGKPFVFHDLRHSFGTLAVQAFALSDVKAYMGHADIATTMVYVHHTPQHRAADRLAAVIDAGEQVPDPGTRVPN